MPSAIEIRNNARKGWLWLIILPLLSIVGCPFTPERPTQAPPPEETIILEPGQSVQFAYPADDLWHSTPYVAVKDAMLLVTPLGNARGLGQQALRFRIGRIPQMVNSRQPLLVSEPGRIQFKFDSAHGGGYTGEIEVSIERQK